MIKVTQNKAKVTEAKKTIALKNILVADMILKDVDLDTGEITDVTEKVRNEIPDDIKTVDFKITVALPETQDNED